MSEKYIPSHRQASQNTQLYFTSEQYTYCFSEACNSYWTILRMMLKRHFVLILR